MASLTEVYRGAAGMDLPRPISEESKEKMIQKAERENEIKWENWRSQPTTKEFLKILEDARSELLVGKVNDKELTIGFPDALLLNPILNADLLRVKLAEIGTLQKVLRATMNGKYNQ